MSDLPPDHHATKFLDSHFLNPDRSNLEAIRKKSNNPQMSSANLRQQWIAEGKLWLSLPLWKGDRILKAVVLHPHAG